MSMPPLPPAGAARGRASWSGLLRLSLVAVPVQAYPAVVSAEETHLYQLHAGCGLRLRHEKHCPAHGKIDAGAVARGYAYAPGRYVALDEADLAQLRPARDQALVLEHFLDPAQLDPALFSGRTLYLVPDGPAAQHPYRVLAQAMRQHARWGVGRVVLSGHRHVALVRPAGRVLVCHVLHHPGQVRPAAACEAWLRDGPVGADEARLAGQLVEAAGTRALPWAAYRDWRRWPRPSSGGARCRRPPPRSPRCWTCSTPCAGAWPRPRRATRVTGRGHHRCPSPAREPRGGRHEDRAVRADAGGPR